ncbi:MAG: peptide deformylase [candidate division Zixibacteria bacterium]|nr:peptide deformylase [candidate division Zixibacteria bacterium]
MATKPIVLYGDPVLREKSEPIEKIDSEIKNLVADMIATLRKAEGLGLAANQVGVAKRVFIIETSMIDGSDEMLVCINPEITETSGEVEYEEGCLSFPGIFERVTRPAEAVLRATDLDGIKFERRADGLFARALLHELDHLNGKLFIDHLSSLSRQLISKKLKKLRSEAA